MMQETRFEELKRYVRFNAQDAELLVRFQPIASAHFPRIAQEFYDRIREHEQAHDVLIGEAQIQRLQRSLVKWMERVCGGVYDQAYYEGTAQIGRVHVRIGLPQRYMFTAMALIRVALLRLTEQCTDEDRGPTQEALVRVLDLELAIMLETYQDALISRIQQVERLEKLELGRALARSEHRYRNAVEFAPALTVGLDNRGLIRLFNREAERVTGYGRDEVLGREFSSVLIAEDLRQHYQDVWLRVTQHKLTPEFLESVLPTRAGKLRDVIWHLAYAASEESDDIVVFAMGNDVTEAKAMRTRTQQAEKLAAVGTLASGLAHEIRNPLNGALLHVSFLERAIRKKDSDPEMLEAAQVVTDEIRRLATLVSEFLDFARPKQLELRSVSLFKLCEQAANLVSAIAGGTATKLVSDLPSSDVRFEGDYGKLEQVLLNLLRNAIEAVQPGGGGTVILRGRRTPRHVTLEVEDDGPGLPSPDAPIFDAFFSTKEGGTGLGLAICHRIVTDHAGSIDVLSSPGRTIFRVILPLERSEGIPHE